MKITEDLCIGCGLCVPYCPSNAISISDKVAIVDYDNCSYCNTCVRAAPCPVEGAMGALPVDSLSPSQLLSRNFSDPVVFSKRRIGSAFDCFDVWRNSSFIGPNEVVLCIEVGRPGLPAALRDLQEIVSALQETKIMCQPPLNEEVLLKQMIEGGLQEDLRNSKIMPLELTYRLSKNELPQALKELKRISQTVRTVMSISVFSRIDSEGNILDAKLIAELGIDYPHSGEAYIQIGGGT